MLTDIYKAIIEFSNKYGALKFNDGVNINAYMKIVDMCIGAGLIPKQNRKEFSTHGRLSAAIAYECNRLAFCNMYI